MDISLYLRVQPRSMDIASVESKVCLVLCYGCLRDNVFKVENVVGSKFRQTSKTNLDLIYTTLSLIPCFPQINKAGHVILVPSLSKHNSTAHVSKCQLHLLEQT